MERGSSLCLRHASFQYLTQCSPVTVQVSFKCYISILGGSYVTRLKFLLTVRYVHIFDVLNDR